MPVGLLRAAVFLFRWPRVSIARLTRPRSDFLIGFRYHLGSTRVRHFRPGFDAPSKKSQLGRGLERSIGDRE